MAKVQRIEGMAGIGLYWCLVEKLYEAGGQLKRDPGTIAFDLKVKVDLVTRLLSDYELFQSDEQNFWSDRVRIGLRDRKAKTLKAKKSANEGWKRRKGNANALRTHSDGNAIREEESRVDKSREEEKRNEERGEKTLAWFEGLFDQIFLEQIQMTHPGKNIQQAIREAFLHAGAAPTRLAALDGPAAKRLLNTWLANMKGGNGHQPRKGVDMTDL